MGRGHLREPFGEDASRTIRPITVELADVQMQEDLHVLHRQVPDPALIAAVDPMSGSATHWTGHARRHPFTGENQADKLATAEAAWRQAAEEGDSEEAPRAALSLGLLREEQGDLEGAKTAYQQAIDRGHTKVAPHAALSLGGVREKQGDLEGAKTAYQQAIDSGYTKWASKAALKLQGLREKQDDGL